MYMNKKGDTALGMRLVLLLVIMALMLLLYMTGIFGKLHVMILGINYNIDTTQIDACSSLYQNDIAGISYKNLLTDDDNDEMFDYVCDFCVCRDGYDGRLCSAMNGQIDMSNPLVKIFGQTPSQGTDEAYYTPMCNKGNDEHLCTTSAAGNGDIDDDFLPDVCDNDPKTYDGKRMKCYEGEVKNSAGKTIGYGHKEMFVDSKEFQCVFTFCSDKAIKYDNYKLFKRYCEYGDVFSMDNMNTDGVVYRFSNSRDYDTFLEDYR